MDKKFFTSLVLSLLTVLSLNYLIKSYQGSSQQAPGVVNIDQDLSSSVGQAVIVPTKLELYAPLDTTIDVIEQAEKDFESAELIISTPYVNAKFSTHGGVITELSYPAHKGKNGALLTSISSPAQQQVNTYEKGLFFLGFNQQAPAEYNLQDSYQTENASFVHYYADIAGWRVHKKYVLYHDRYHIDLSIDYEARGDKQTELKSRLFVPAPLDYTLKDDTGTLLALNEVDAKIESKDAASVQNMAWHWKTSKVIFGGADRYFLHTLFNDASKFVQRAYCASYNDNKQIVSILEGPAIKSATSYTLSFYCGPKLVDELGKVDERLEELLAFGWLSLLCKLMVKMLQIIVFYVHNYGLAIILLSILLKLPFVPFSMYARGKMEHYQKFQPTLARIGAKYKNDPRRKTEEIMKFHHDHNLSPATPLLGLMPTLMQIPIMWGLYRVLSVYVNLYQAPFFGWVTDLSARDPYYGLPIILGLSMILMMSSMSFQDEKQRVVSILSSFVLTGFVAGFPAGLLIYWLMNNLLTMVEEFARKTLMRTRKG